MDAREVKALVGDFGQWKGDAYRLAMLVAALIRQKCVEQLEGAGQTEAADLIRGP
jgi:hypothetical protein